MAETKWTEDQITKIDDWIDGHNLADCKVCGKSKQMGSDPEICVVPYAFPHSGRGGIGATVVRCYCLNCAHVELLDAEVIGVWKK